MLNYVEHLKLLYDKEHIELEEYRRLLAEHNLLPGEKGSMDTDDARRSLPPRSHSLSSSSKPVSPPIYVASIFNVMLFVFIEHALIFSYSSSTVKVSIDEDILQNSLR